MNGRKAGFQKEITATGSGGGEMRGAEKGAPTEMSTHELKVLGDGNEDVMHHGSEPA